MQNLTQTHLQATEMGSSQHCNSPRYTVLHLPQIHLQATEMQSSPYFLYECPLVVLACESLHVCTVRIWRCEHARFCVEVFYALYINFHSFIHSYCQAPWYTRSPCSSYHRHIGRLDAGHRDAVIPTLQCSLVHQLIGQLHYCTATHTVTY